MALDVINYDALPQALAAVKVAVETSDDDLAYELGRLDPILQYLVACAFVFCAACHPMSIYYGYGCGVMNDTTWANPEHRSTWNMDIDQAIAYLKSIPHPWKLLKKSPSQIGKTEPVYEQCDKKSMKLIQGIYTDLFKQCEKHGYPQPLPPNDNIKIGTWAIPFATYGGTSIYADHAHNFLSSIGLATRPGPFSVRLDRWRARGSSTWTGHSAPGGSYRSLGSLARGAERNHVQGSPGFGAGLE